MQLIDEIIGEVEKFSGETRAESIKRLSDVNREHSPREISMLYEMCVRTRKLDSERLQDVAAMMTSSTAHGSELLRTLRILNLRLSAMTKN